MFLVVVEKGEAFSVGLECLLEFLDDRAAGSERPLSCYGVGIGQALGDVSSMTKFQALAESEKIRAAMRMGQMDFLAA